MKRSEIQLEIEKAKSMTEKCGFRLPSFAYWTMDEWKAHYSEAETIVRTMRGWDVTSFGRDDFSATGAVLFTLRNGLPDSSCGCPYAEKVIFMQEGQTLPFHFHYNKTEDIINRGGGVLLIRVYNSKTDGSIDPNGDVRIILDGINQTVPAGTDVEILPGNSMTIYPGLYHRFQVKNGLGAVLAGEVSAVNDDRTDNRFETECQRFIPVEEDTEITVPLCNEYEKLFGHTIL